MRGRSWVPPIPGKMPSVVSGTPNTALSLATMKSESAASSQPPASAKPSTAAMTGTGTAQDAEGRLLEDHVLGPPGLVGHLVALLEIAAGTERAVAGPGEDHRPDQWIAGESVEAGQEILAQRRVHGVHLLGPVHGDGDDEAVRRALDEEMAIGGHAMILCARSERTSSRV